MKKNITINLFGTLYAVDEDACNLLEQYLDNMKGYFERREGGDEIVDDIEHRVAEIFSEMKAEGIQAINIDHVRDIIHRIGNPEEMDDETPAAENATADPDQETAEKNIDGEEGEQKTTADDVPPRPPFQETESNDWLKRCEKWLSRRRLFRDPDDVILGGVTSGLCHFFGANDPLPWRILLVIVSVFSFFTIGIIYLIAWTLIPQARTAEDRLRMRGIEVTPQTLNDFLIKETQDRTSQSAFHSTGVRSFFGVLGSVFVFLLKLALFCLLCAPLLFFIAMLGFMFYVLIDSGSSALLAEMFDSEFATAFQYPVYVGALWIIGISGFVALFIPLVVLIRTFNRTPDAKPMRGGTRLTLLMVSLLSAVLCVASIIYSAFKYHQIKELERQKIEYRDGYYMSEADRSLLAQNNWKVRTYDNCNDREWLYVSSNDLFDENDYVKYQRYLKGSKDKEMSVNVERTVYYPEGYYRLAVVGFAKSAGAFVYAKPDSLQTVAVEIPTDDAQGNGNLKSLSLQEVSRLSFAPADMDSTDWKDYIQRRLSGWSYAQSAPFYHPGGNITYGITNIPGVVGRPATNAHAWNFGVRYLDLVRLNDASLSGAQQPQAAKGKQAVKQQ